jgi:23S rRNA (cytosine1962-C5)-methyltransferase
MPGVMVTPEELAGRLALALDARAELVDARHETAFRAFNGFVEGCPQLLVDVYAHTAVLHDYSEPSDHAAGLVDAAVAFLVERSPWLRAVVLKPRRARDAEARRGRLVRGEPSDLDHRVREHGVWYAFEPLVNQDASFYVDMRDLRAWALEHLEGKTVLNTFAYTGSLGVAARAAGARRVVHLDLNKAFLNVAKTSYTLNGFPIAKGDFRAGDFWTLVNGFKRTGELFDCVFVDPPFFSTTAKGTVDLVSEYARVLNKVRPLVADGGWLVAVNNAIFVSGADYFALLERQCGDGYLSVESLVPVPADATGYPETRVASEPADPAPFAGSTKIAILRVRRKDGRTS